MNRTYAFALSLLAVAALGWLATPSTAEEDTPPKKDRPPPSQAPKDGPPRDGPPKRGGERGPRGGGADMAIRMADADRDGTVTADEWKTYIDGLQKHFKTLDKDGDGAISKSEMPERRSRRGEGRRGGSRRGPPDGERGEGRRGPPRGDKDGGRRGPPPPADDGE